MTVEDDGSIVVEGAEPLDISIAADEERLLITHVREEPGGGAGRADAVVAGVPDRGTQLDVGASVSKSGVSFTFSRPVYLDGLTRQAFVTALNELVSAVDSVAAGPAAPTSVQAPVVAQEEQTEASEPQTDTAEVQTAPGAWDPTHRVPSGGLRAWEEPDPSAQPITRLEPRVELQVAERRGDWARVVGSNGWTGWVDARKLEGMGAASPSPASGSGSGSTIDIAGFSVRPLPLAGAAGLVIASFLPWVDVAGTSSNSFDLALSFLWDYTAAGSPYLGWLVLALAAFALYTAAAPTVSQGLKTLPGVLSIAVAAGFVLQMYRGISDGGGTIGDVFDFVGIGAWVTLAAGVSLLAAARR